MKIDRTRFLVLTGALAAAAAAAGAPGCTQSSAKADGGTTTVPEAGDDDAGTPSSDASGDVAREAGACLGDTPAETRECTELGGMDDAGVPLDGSVGDAGETCIQSISGQTACDDLKLYTTGAVARDAIQCLLTLPTCEGLGTTTTCAMAALRKACPDPAAATLCQQILGECAEAGADAGTTQAECEQLVSGLSTEGRQRLVQCTSEGGACFTDVTTCVGFLF